MTSYVPLMLLLLAANPPVEQRAVDIRGNCQLILDGTQIKQIQLEKEGGGWHALYGTQPVARMQPGRYRVGIIMLNGDYTYAAPRNGGEWFTLSEDKPYHLQAGAPLVPKVDVSPQLRCLRMDYRGVADAAGRLYYGKSSAELAGKYPTRFSICRDGREIAAGTLIFGKYG
jgi:hypothetical protein